MSMRFSFAAVLLILIGCESNDIGTDFIRKYFAMTSSEQIIQLGDFSVEEQYAIFLYGNQVVHPPAIHLARPFAEQGAELVPFLKLQLEGAADEETIRDIVSVLVEMNYLELYDFSNDPELMMLLEEKSNGMRGVWKETTIKMILDIQE